VTYSSLLPILLLVVAFYFLVLRPARARQAAQQAIAARLEPGVEIMTTSGLYGRVIEIDGDDVLLEIADGVRVRFVAAAVGKVIVPEAGDADPDGTSAHVQPSVREDDAPTG
jgi:preprotein translocase subunit YajC